jgi:hypothetical protein
MPFFILSLIVQVSLVVHVLKTGRNTLWVFVLIFAPLIGTLAYIIVELLPEWTDSRGARAARRNLGRAINPNKGLQVATDRLAVADTAQNAIALAEECMLKQRFTEAKELYSRALKGLYADDPVLLMGLARAHFALGEYAAVIERLTELKAKNPSHTSADGHLLFARAQQELGNKTTAIEEYEALVNYYPGPEPACRLAMMLKGIGEPEKATALFNRVMNESKTAGRHYNTIHKEWVATARRELAS